MRLVIIDPLIKLEREPEKYEYRDSPSDDASDFHREIT